MDPVDIKQEISDTPPEIDVSIEVKREYLDDFDVESFLLQGSICGYSSGSLGDIIHQKCANCGALFPKPSTNIRNDVNGRMINSVCSECYEEKRQAARKQLLSLNSKNDYEKPTTSKQTSNNKQTETSAEPTGCLGCHMLSKIRENFEYQAIATELNDLDRDKLLTCLVCGAKILGRSYLNIHMKRHFDEGATCCKTCRENSSAASHNQDNLTEKKWTPELNTKLLIEYRKKNCLWNKDDRDYRNKMVREEAMSEVIKAMNIEGFNIHLARNKIRSLRTVYWSEVTKIQNSPPDNPHIPKPSWFSIADSFLKLTKPNVISDNTEPFLAKKRFRSSSNSDFFQEESTTEPQTLTNNVENSPTENLENLDSRSFANYIVSELMKISPNEILDLKMDILKVFADRRKKRGKNIEENNTE